MRTEQEIREEIEKLSKLSKSIAFDWHSGWLAALEWMLEEAEI